MQRPLGLERTYRAIGVMSGTSLDGLDIAVSQFTRLSDGSWKASLEQFEGVPFPEEWRVRLAGLAAASAEEWCATAAAWSTWCGDQVRLRVDPTGIDVVAFHGQTVFHRPAAGWTGQLASGAHFHLAVGSLPVVCDFRSLDVAAGGQGAPLVPLADALSRAHTLPHAGNSRLLQPLVPDLLDHLAAHQPVEPWTRRSQRGVHVFIADIGFAVRAILRHR